MRDSEADAPAARAPLAAWVMVAIFLFFFVVSHIDRSIITMMVGPIERDLGVSDFQMSLLLGPAFGIFYVLCGVPLGWLIDRFSRRWMTFLGVMTWGIATATCGFAGSYLHLFIARMGVGVGESTLTPAAHSLVSDTFPRRQLASAMSVYAMGAIVGGGLAMAVGGVVVQLTSANRTYHIPVLGDFLSWQVVFVTLGLFTLLSLPLVAFLREGPSGRATQTHAEVAAPADVGLGDLMRKHGLLFIGMPLGFGLIAVLTNAYSSWVPTFMMRTYGWNAAQVGLACGLHYIVTGAIGQVVSVIAVDRMYARGIKDAHVRYPMLSLLISAPAALWAFNSGGPWAFLLLISGFYVLTNSFFGYASAGIQQFTPSHLRGRVSAIFLTVLTIVGVGLGAPLTGWMTEYVFADKARLGTSLTIVTLVISPLIAGTFLVVSAKIRRMGAVKAAEVAEASA